VPEKGGFKGWIGVAEEVSDISLACRQIGPIRFKAKFEQGEDVFRKRRSLFFKKMQIVRGCDVKRNVLVYMVYSDRLIEGSSVLPRMSALMAAMVAPDEASRT
jgi:CreA protein